MNIFVTSSCKSVLLDLNKGVSTRGERACNSHRTCTEGEMLAVTKNRTKCVGGSPVAKAAASLH